MCPRIALLASLAAGLSIGIAPALGQVSVDLHALDKLNAAPPAPDARGTRPAPTHGAHGRTRTTESSEHHAEHTRRHTERAESSHKPAAGTEGARRPETPAAPEAGAPPAARPGTTAAAPPAATLPTAPPPAAHLAPLAPPLPSTTPPPKPPVTADAGGDAFPIADGMRVTFQPNRFDLSAETTEALKHFAHALPRSDNVTLDVRAYAAGRPDDPSSARRLSLSRTLAIRAALLSEGIPSTRIFLRALGANAGEGPADRCDIMISRLGQEPPAPGREARAHPGEHPATQAASAPAAEPAPATPTAHP